MNGKYVFITVALLALLVGTLAVALGAGHLVLLNPAGTVAAREGALMWLALRLMALVVLPVFILTGAIAWHYRAGNTRARYLPNWANNNVEEAVWWLVPLVIITVLAVITWQSAHALDSYRPLPAGQGTHAAPLTVEVISLNWKWLFIYPAQGIATVNYLELPVGTPVDFALTSDAPMNALWIPQLGGQEMSMPGMVTHLNLRADVPGTYRGLSGNYSGAGFAGMHFAVVATSSAAFGAWAAGVTATAPALTRAAYEALAAPSQNTPPAVYRLADPGLYTWVVMRYMAPPHPSQGDGSGMPAMPGM